MAVHYGGDRIAWAIQVPTDEYGNRTPTFSDGGGPNGSGGVVYFLLIDGSILGLLGEIY